MNKAELEKMAEEYVGQSYRAYFAGGSVPIVAVSLQEAFIAGFKAAIPIVFETARAKVSYYNDDNDGKYPTPADFAKSLEDGK